MTFDYAGGEFTWLFRTLMPPTAAGVMISGGQDPSFGFLIRGACFASVHEVTDTHSLGQEQWQGQQKGETASQHGNLIDPI
jgi:hypothetical protein